MSDKINISNPAQVREWEERIARFEGWHIEDGGNGINVGYSPAPNAYYKGADSWPNYSRSLPDLFRVLDTLPEWSIKKHRHPFYPDVLKILVEIKGLEGGYLANTPEDAIFGAICQYISTQPNQEAPEPQGYKAAGEGGITLHEYNAPEKGGTRD